MLLAQLTDLGDLLQCSGLMSCHEPARDDVLKQDYLEGGQDGAAVEHLELLQLHEGLVCGLLHFL